MSRRRFPHPRLAILAIIATIVAACSSVSPQELSDRYRADDLAPAPTLPAPTLAPPVVGDDSPSDGDSADAGDVALGALSSPNGSTDGRPVRSTPLSPDWGTCPFDDEGLDVDCGRITIPSASSSVDDIEIAFARFNAEGPAQPDPVVYLHGGPGSAVLAGAQFFYAEVVAPFIDDRDVIIYDQRGAGESSPLPLCTEAWDVDLDFFATATPHDELATAYIDVLTDCAERIQRRADYDLSDYASAVHADDLVDLARALGYPEVNLFGASYGTRLAQTILRDHPGIVRSAVLSSVYPIDVNLIGSTPAALEQAMRYVFSSCEADDTCNRLLPDPVATLETWVERLDAAPLLVDLPIDEQSSYPFQLAGDDLIGMLHSLLYTADGAALIPDLLIDLDANDTDRLSRLAGLANLNIVDVAAHLAVQCREEVPFTTAEELDAAAALNTIWDRISLLPGFLGDHTLEVCAAWDEIGEAGPIENEPVTWDQPTLVFAGAFDPITPPEWGEALAERLPNATFALAPNRGHDPDAGLCGFDILAAFVSFPNATVDVSCLGDIPLPRLMNTNVEIFDRTAVELEDSIFDIDPSSETEWIDMRLPTWGADFYEDEEVYWRNVDIYDYTAIVVRAGPFDPDALTAFLPFEVRRNRFSETATPSEVGPGWERLIFETDSLDIVSYVATGSVEMNVSVVAGDTDLAALEQAIIEMARSADIS